MRRSKKMLMKKPQAAAAEVGDDGILQQIDAEEAVEIELSAQPFQK